MYKIIAQNLTLVSRREIWESRHMNQASVSRKGEDLILSFAICSDIELRQALKVYRQLKKGMDPKVLGKISFETLSSDQKWIIGKALLLPKHSERFNKSQKEIIFGLFISQDRVKSPVLSKKLLENFLSASRSLLPESKDFSQSLYCSDSKRALEPIFMQADQNTVLVLQPIALSDGESIKSLMEVAKQLSSTHKKYSVLHSFNLREAFPDDNDFRLYQESSPYLIINMQDKSYEQTVAVLQSKGCSVIPVRIMPEGYV